MKSVTLLTTILDNHGNKIAGIVLGIILALAEIL